MSRRLRSAVFAAVAICASIGAAAASVRESLSEALRGAGLCEGVDAATGEVVAIGSASRRMHGAKAVAASVRDECCKIASLEARAEILRTLGAKSSAGRSADFSHDGSNARRAVVELFETMAAKSLSGWRIVDVRDGVKGDSYSVAVAVAWSPTKEALLSKAKARSVFPAGGWRGEVEAFLGSQDFSRWCFTRTFFDSAGYPHVMGVGVADWDGDPRTKNARVGMAIEMAKKNLALAMFGDSTVREMAEKKLCMMREGGIYADDVESLYSSLALVDVSMTMPKGVRDLHIAEVPSGEGNGARIVSVFGFAPDPPPVRAVSPLSAPAAGVKVYNPVTGNYEERH